MFDDDYGSGDSGFPDDLPSSQMSIAGQHTEHIYVMTCAILPVIEVNDCGQGWGPADAAHNIDRFDAAQNLKELRAMVKKTDGQELAKYLDNPLISRVDLVVASPNKAEFYVHVDDALDDDDIQEMYEALCGTLSDGWGAGFEQQNFNLKTSSAGGQVQYQLGFAFDDNSVTQPLSYNAATMRSLAQVSQLAERAVKTAKHRI